jgi:hypothetical protein
MDVGVIYILSNPDSSLAKVGLSRADVPQQRAKHYTYQHGIQWRVFWTSMTRNVGVVEAQVHDALAGRRFSRLPAAREVFHVTPQEAQRVAARHIVPLTIEEQRGYQETLVADEDERRQERERRQEIRRERERLALIERTRREQENLRPTKDGLRSYKLTDRFVRRIASEVPPAREIVYSDQMLPRHYVRVRPPSRPGKLWPAESRIRYTLPDGCRRWVTTGNPRTMTLTLLREAARAALAVVDAGGDLRQTGPPARSRAKQSSSK